jgi:hypothetical protein
LHYSRQCCAANATNNSTCKYPYAPERNINVKFKAQDLLIPLSGISRYFYMSREEEMLVYWYWDSKSHKIFGDWTPTQSSESLSCQGSWQLTCPGIQLQCSGKVRKRI